MTAIINEIIPNSAYDICQNVPITINGTGFPDAKVVTTQIDTNAWNYPPRYVYNSHLAASSTLDVIYCFYIDTYVVGINKYVNYIFDSTVLTDLLPSEYNYISCSEDGQYILASIGRTNFNYSTNGGSTWTSSVLSGGPIGAMVMSKDGLNLHRIRQTNYIVIEKSTNNIDWQLTYTPLLFEMKLFPITYNIYGIIGSQSGDWLICNGIDNNDSTTVSYISTDRGISWIDAAFPTDTLDIVVSENQQILIGRKNSTNKYVTWSTDGGDTWTTSDTMDTGNTGWVFMTPNAEILLACYNDPFYNTDSILYKSTNYGASWQTITLTGYVLIRSPCCANNTSYWVMAATHFRLESVHSNHVLYSADAGSSWTSIYTSSEKSFSAPELSDLTNVKISKDHQCIYFREYASDLQNMVYEFKKTDNIGTSWSTTYSSAAHFIFDIGDTGNVVLFRYDNDSSGAVKKSVDYGTTFGLKEYKVISLTSTAFLNNYSVYLSIGHKIFRADDYFAPILNSNVETFINFDISKNGQYLMFTGATNIYTSSDSGYTWKHSGNVTALVSEIYPILKNVYATYNENILYLNVESTDVYDTYPYINTIYSSSDNGDTWDNTSYSGPYSSIPKITNSIAYQQRGAEGYNFRISRDNGVTWEYTPLSILFFNPQYNVVAYNNDIIIADTASGLWRYTINPNIGINFVAIGPIYIDYNTITSTSIDCTLNLYSNYASSIPVDVSIILSDNSSVTLPDSFTLLGYYYDVTIPDPPQSLPSGGMLFIVKGNFFDSNTGINIDGQPCTVELINSSTLQVTSIEYPYGQYNVELISLIDTNYVKYINTITYTDMIFYISSLSSNRSNPRGGNQITITGDGFNETCDVFIGDKQATIESLTQTQIVITVPPNLPGKYELVIRKENNTYNPERWRIEEESFVTWSWCCTSSDGNTLRALRTATQQEEPLLNNVCYTFKSSNRGKTWNYVSSVENFYLPPANYASISQKAATYATSDLSSIFCLGRRINPENNIEYDTIIVSNDYGETWQELASTPFIKETTHEYSLRSDTEVIHYYASKNTQYQTLIILDKTMHHPNYKLYVTNDFGQTWNLKYERALDVLDNRYDLACAIIANDGSKVSFLSNDENMYTNITGEETWDITPFTLNGNYIDNWSISADTTGDYIIVADWSNDIFATINLYCTQNGGILWESVYNNISKNTGNISDMSCDTQLQIVLSSVVG